MDGMRVKIDNIGHLQKFCWDLGWIYQRCFRNNERNCGYSCPKLVKLQDPETGSEFIEVACGENVIQYKYDPTP